MYTYIYPKTDIIVKYKKWLKFSIWMIEVNLPRVTIQLHLTNLQKKDTKNIKKQ